MLRMLDSINYPMVRPAGLEPTALCLEVRTDATFRKSMQAWKVSFQAGYSRPFFYPAISTLFDRGPPFSTSKVAI